MHSLEWIIVFEFKLHIVDLNTEEWNLKVKKILDSLQKQIRLNLYLL